MRNQVLYSMLGMAVLFLVNGCQKPVQPDPTLELSQTEVAVPAEGGTYSVAFKVTNPKDGAEVTVAAPEVDWVTNVVVGESDITFDVAKNETTEARTAKVAVSYPGIEPDAEFTISQEAGEPAPFVITVKDITETTATFDVVPNDPDMSYICFATSQEYLDFNGLTTDEAVYQDDMAYIDESGYTFDYFITQGSITDSPISGMLPNTENVVYAYGVDPVSRERLTDVIYARFSTLPVEMIETNFTFGEPAVDGPSVSVDVSVNGYDGYWTAYALATSSISPDETVYDYCSQLWSEYVSIYQMFGFSNEEILEANCISGDYGLSFSLEPNTAYTIAVFAINDQLLACSEPTTIEVTTGSVEPSDNVITIEVSDITGTTANISFLPTNEDPYAYAVFAASDLEGMTDEEIIAGCIDSYPYETSGPIVDAKFTGMTPETSYTVVAFGYEAGVSTTGLFKNTFTTAAGISGNVDFELQFDEYYDVLASAEAFRNAGYADDADYLEYVFEAGLDVLMPVTAVTTPEVGTYFYVILTDVEGNHVDDQTYIDFLMYNGTSSASTLYTLNYDEPMFAVGVAFDDFGVAGPVWKSESFTLTRDGVSDPQGVIDYLYGSSSTTSTTSMANAPTSIYKVELNNMRSNVERFTPEQKIIKPEYKGGELKYVLPDNMKLPEAGSLQKANSTERTFFRK